MDPANRQSEIPAEARTASTDRPLRFSTTRILTLLLALGVAVVLLQAARDLTTEPVGLTDEVVENLGESGVTHPVTAVLLNFRGYDTFLEVTVLALAVLGVLAVRRENDLSSVRIMTPAPLQEDPILNWLVRLLVPLFVLSGGYLLWLGTFAPGGAFQAAALLAAGGVMLRLSGHPSVALFRGLALHIALLLGLLVFLAVAVGTMVFGNNLLELPTRGTGLVMLAIETAVMLSIAVILVALFVGAQPRRRGDSSERQ